MSGCPDSSAPYVAEVSLARLFGMSNHVRAAQRYDSFAPLAASIDRHDWRHATRMKNAPGYGPRQRRQLQAMLGGGLRGICKMQLQNDKILLTISVVYRSNIALNRDSLIPVTLANVLAASLVNTIAAVFSVSPSLSRFLFPNVTHHI